MMVSIPAAWQHLSTSEDLRRSSHTVAVIDHQAYVFGGELRPRQPRDDQVYRINLQGSNDSNVSQMTVKSERPTPRVGSACTALGGKIYFFSGRGGLGMTPVEEQGGLWAFNTVDSIWEFISPANSNSIPQPRSYHCMTNNGTNRVFVHAGCPDSGRLSDLWSFDIEERVWTQHADAPAPPRGGASITFKDGLLYRMNGFDGKTEQGGTLDIYDLASNTWDFNPFPPDGKSGPGPRSVGTLLPIECQGQTLLVTIFGEGDPSALGHAGAGQMFDDIWAFNISKQSWHLVQTGPGGDALPIPRGWFGAAVVGDSTIVVSGGLAASNERLHDCWLLKF